MKSFLKYALLFTLIFNFICCKNEPELDELDTLLDFLAKKNDSKVGFLSGANYQSVKKILPSNTKAVIVAHEEDLTQMVLNGTLDAALVTGLPDTKYHDLLHIFSSSIISLHAVLMAPDTSTDYPHGNPVERSTYDLSLAINAAIARIQYYGIDEQIAKKNAPKEIVQSHTCKSDLLEQFNVPNKNAAKGFLRDILDKKVIRVLADGPYNWGDNDGNYLVNPPVGFYPDLLDAIVKELASLSGPDNVPYGSISIQRVYNENRSLPFPWYKLFDGGAHISEPYFILDAAYGGSNKPCKNDSDCLPGGVEKCDRYCKHAAKPRSYMFRESCTVLGTDSKFFTKRNKSKDDGGNGKSGTSGGVIAALVLLSVFLALSISAIAVLLVNEKRGHPLLYP